MDVVIPVRIANRRLWVAKTSSAHKPLICSNLRPSGCPLFFVIWLSLRPREQPFARHRGLGLSPRLSGDTFHV